MWRETDLVTQRLSSKLEFTAEINSIAFFSTMKIPTVENFFCCLKLRTGGLVYGWLGTVLFFLGTLAFVLAEYREEHAKSDLLFSIWGFLEFIVSIYLLVAVYKNNAGHLNKFLIFQVILMVFFIAAEVIFFIQSGFLETYPVFIGDVLGFGEFWFHLEEYFDKFVCRTHRLLVDCDL